MAKKSNEKQIENMRKLGYSEEEIAEMLADDLAIERSNTADKVFDWEMDVEEHKKAMKNANVDEKKKPAEKATSRRERKPNMEKRDLIDIISCALREAGYETTVSNLERTVEFSIGEQNYSFTLTAHRKPK